MRKFVLFVSVLFFGLVKSKGQELQTPLAASTASTAVQDATSGNCYWKSSNLFSKQRPIELISFYGKMNNSRITLEWAIAGNENANLFEVEKSANGKDFSTAGLVFSSEKEGTEQYAFFEKAPKKSKMFYRIKLIDKSQSVDYSDILSIATIDKIKS